MIVMRLMSTVTFLMFLSMLAGFSACNFETKKSPESTVIWDSLEVTASAYNSLSWQTAGGNPSITAWGDTLKTGLKAIAVSRDLIEKGLDHNTPVKIEGFDGVFLVKDKMHYRWKNKIDIYMDEDVQKAREWGRRKVKIYFAKTEVDTLN